MAEEKKDFVVKDRRIFAQDNENEREEREAERDIRESESKSKRDESSSQRDEPAQKEIDEDMPLPGINFSMFVFSLNSSALLQLGLIEDPTTGRKTKNLALAKQTIDIIGMIDEKTRGNLIKEEENLIKSILYDLRMLYVKERAAAKEGKK